MARVLKLATENVQLDLLDASGQGIYLAGGDDNWQPKEAEFVAEGVPPNLVEEMALIARGTSHNGLASVLNQWNDMRQRVVQYENRMPGASPVWLHAKLDNETNERRALVRRIDSAIASSGISDTANANRIRIMAAIERHPYWEDASGSAPSFPAGSASGLVFSYDYGDVGGNVPARIVNLQLYQPVTFAPMGTVELGHAIDKVWVGIRTLGASPNFLGERFHSYYEARRMDVVAGVSQQIADSEASGGTAIVIASGSASAFTKAATANLYYAIGSGVTPDKNMALQHGRFLWLTRARVEGGTWQLYLRHGHEYQASTQYIQGPTVQVSGTAWMYYEMGIQEIPLRNVHAHDEQTVSDDNLDVQYWAKQVSGSGNMRLCGTVMLPVEHGFLKLDKAGFNPDLTFAYICSISSSPEDETESVTVRSPFAEITARPTLEAENFYLPPKDKVLDPGDGCMFIVFQRSTASVLTDMMWIYSTYSAYRPRYLSLRGTG